MSTAKIKLEEVFKKSGVPTHTFVKPTEYQKLLIALRTPGRGIIIEGPSGIGKTTSVVKAIGELGLEKTSMKLSARKKDEAELIKLLPTNTNVGVVVIDDFHWLDANTKRAIADYIKILADEEDEKSKVVVIGINRAGDSLIKFASDLSGRIDTIKFEKNPEERIQELIELGEKTLNVTLNTKQEIVKDSQGSFNIAQTLCHESCLLGGVTEQCEKPTDVKVSLEVVRENVLGELSTKFFEVSRKFATGPRLRREGRAPYLHLLYWLAVSNEWTLNVDEALAQHPNHKGSVGQIVDKGLLESFLSSNPEFGNVIHFDSNTHILGVEDPKYVYYLRNLLWTKFAKQVGFMGMEFKSKYDFALSFSGTDRDIAAPIFDKLNEQEIAVFYDKNEQHRILAQNVEDYLGPIYRSEAKYVIALLGKDYPKKIWTKFESEQFKKRFGDNSVIPIWFADAPPGMFDETTQIGGITIDRSKDLTIQIEAIIQILVKKLAEARTSEFTS